MKFGGFIAVTSENLIYREHQFIGIYTFNCRDLRWSLLISRAAPATPQKYRVSGETRMVKTSNSLSSFFLQRPTCYRVSRFGANRTPINRSKIFDRTEFTADVRFFRGFVGNREVSHIVVEIRSLVPRDYETQPRRRWCYRRFARKRVKKTKEKKNFRKSKISK